MFEIRHGGDSMYCMRYKVVFVHLRLFDGANGTHSYCLVLGAQCSYIMTMKKILHKSVFIFVFNLKVLQTDSSTVPRI